MLDIAAVLRSKIAGQVTTQPDDLTQMAGDFGRIIERIPAVVVRPVTPTDIVAAVRVAAQRGVPVTTRGSAHSQSGQGLCRGGILVDGSSLSGEITIDEDRLTATCLAGTTWGDLVDATLGRSLLPLVLTNNLSVTLGGTLSVAGIGVASFRYASQADICEELEVVTGDGELRVCNRSRDRELFDSVRAGLGQTGIITRATVRLRRCRASTRTFFLLYDDLGALMRDERALIERDEVDYLESWCVPCPQGFRDGPMGLQMFAAWFFPLHVTVELDASAPARERVLDGIAPYKVVHVGDRPVSAFVRRLDPLFDLWRRMGYWAHAHPWMETILPWENTETYVSQVLANLPPPALGGGHVLLWPARGRISDAPLFRTPSSELVMGFGILPGVPRDLLPQAISRLAMASDLATAVGARRYLSGYLDFDRERWQAHYGDRWTWFCEQKRRFDPHGILNPHVIPFQ